MTLTFEGWNFSCFCSSTERILWQKAQQDHQIKSEDDKGKLGNCSYLHKDSSSSDLGSRCGPPAFSYSTTIQPQAIYKSCGKNPDSAPSPPPRSGEPPSAQDYNIIARCCKNQLRGFLRPKPRGSESVQEGLWFRWWTEALPSS